MIYRHILALTAVALVCPVTAQAETVTDPVVSTTTTRTTTTTVPHYKETMVLKGYRIKTTYTNAMPSAPVVGPTYFDDEEVFIPVEDMQALPPAAGMETDAPVVQDTEHKTLRAYRGMSRVNN